MNEIDKLFDGMQEDKPIGTTLEESLGIAQKVPEKDKEEATEEPHKNRRHRRWETQLSEKEKDLIAREARLEALSEVDRFNSESKDLDVDSRLLRMYGDNENGKEAAKLHQQILKDAIKEARQDALKDFQQVQEETAREQKQYESFIDSQLEDIEDQFNVDVTSDAPAARKARREFLEVVQSLSPKDESGTITDYADFSGAWEMYQLKKAQEKPVASNDRQKELSSRSMTKSGNVNNDKQNEDLQEKWLRENGIRTR